MMLPRGIWVKDVILAYDDDAKGNMGSKDVTLAYNDNAKGTMSTRDELIAEGKYRLLGCNIYL